MAISPQSSADGILNISVSSGGRAIADSIEIVALEVNRAIGAIPNALLTFVDGKMPTSEWPLADAETLVPGAKISIKAGYGESQETIFEGIVVKLSARISESNASHLLIYCQDEAVMMTLGRNSANFIDQSDTDIISSLIAAHGLSADVAATHPVHGSVVQFDCSDWDFLMMRAEANGLMVVVDAGKISARPPDVSSAAPVVVEWGVDLIDFQADLDARGQLSSVEATSWNPANQQIVRAAASGQQPNRQGNLSQADLAEALGIKALRLPSATMLDTETLATLASAQQVRSGLARIQGHMTFAGCAAVVVGGLIEVKGVGQRYSGEAFVGGVTHRISGGEWRTRVEFGLPASRHAEQSGVAAPKVLGLLPPASGIQIGIVMRLDQDPAGEYRIQVDIPVLDAETKGVWARLIQQSASQDFGTFYVPEIGDEVVIGYINEDPSSPIILGSVYSSSRPPPYSLDAENRIKAIVTRSKARIEINDEDGTITVKTAANNAVIICDRDQSISLSDEHGNIIKLDANGITLNSCKDIAFTAKGQINAEAGEAIGLSAGTDIAATGTNVSIEAQSTLTCKGSVSAEVSALGTTILRGAMVMIN